MAHVKIHKAVNEMTDYGIKRNAILKLDYLIRLLLMFYRLMFLYVP